MSTVDSLPQRFPSEYATWLMIRQRCENPNQPDYRHYGGRGIKVSKRWASFAAFMEDMGPRPEGYVLTRKSPDSHFWPSTCSWQPRGVGLQQRRGEKLTMRDAERIRERHRKGETRTDLARRYGVSLTHICMIVNGTRWRGPQQSKPAARKAPRKTAPRKKARRGKARRGRGSSK
jgi:hypothetical protein